MTEPSGGQRRLAAMPRLPRLLARALAVAFALAVSMSACSLGSVGIPATGPLVTVTMRGGMCAGGACDNSVILNRDGRVNATDVSIVRENQQVGGTVAPLTVPGL